MKIKALFFLIFFAGINLRSIGQSKFNSNGIPDSVISLCNKISKEGIIMSHFVGKSLRIPEQWNRFEKLTTLSSDQVLFQLTDHTDPVVRCYAMLGLIDRKSDLLIEALRKNENDTVKVSYYQGCIKSTIILIDLMVGKINPHDFKNWNSQDRKYFKKLSTISRRRTLD